MQDPKEQSPIETDKASEPVTDYTYYAKLALVLYFVLWVPGFLVNAVYLAQALGDERRTGKTPEGKKQLIILLIAGMVVPFLGVCVLVAISLAQVGI